MGVEVLIMIPVAGVTVSLVARTLAKVRRDTMEVEGAGHLAARVAALQEEVESLSAEVKELRAAQDFDRTLLGERGTRGS
ncbi:MAG: hypothetical protein FJ207_05720 [Gemmatimonadetes bacterium]|nr:hypothetical protein [Gemmatimonadota bacterium]